MQGFFRAFYVILHIGWCAKCLRIRHILRPSKECTKCDPKSLATIQGAVFMNMKRYGWLNNIRRLREHLRMEQGNSCKICKTTFGEKRPNIDHDHYSGLIREALCTDCNMGLGAFKDSVDLLEAAAEYLMYSSLDIETGSKLVTTTKTTNYGLPLMKIIDKLGLLKDK